MHSEVLIGVRRWKHWSFGFMKQLFNNVKEFFSDFQSSLLQVSLQHEYHH